MSHYLDHPLIASCVRYMTNVELGSKIELVFPPNRAQSNPYALRQSVCYFLSAREVMVLNPQSCSLQTNPSAQGQCRYDAWQLPPDPKRVPTMRSQSLAVPSALGGLRRSPILHLDSALSILAFGITSAPREVVNFMNIFKRRMEADSQTQGVTTLQTQLILNLCWLCRSLSRWDNVALGWG